MRRRALSLCRGPHWAFASRDGAWGQLVRLPGVSAVADEIGRLRPDFTLNLGDQLWGQADPTRALAIERTLGPYEVRGNNDERLTLPASQLEAGHVQLQVWLRTTPGEAELTQLSALPTDLLLADSAVLATHGMPGSPWDSLLWAWAAQVFRPPSEPEIQRRLASFPEPELVLVGPMHGEAGRRVRGRLLVNVGPVAYQKRRRSPGPLARASAQTQTLERAAAESQLRLAGGRRLDSEPPGAEPGRSPAARFTGQGHGAVRHRAVDTDGVADLRRCLYQRGRPAKLPSSDLGPVTQNVCSNSSVCARPGGPRRNAGPLISTAASPIRIRPSVPSNRCGNPGDPKPAG